MDYTDKFSDIKHPHDEAAKIIERIHQYTEHVRKGQITCNVGVCKHCEVISDYFKRHEARKRRFYVVVDQFVQVVFALLVRWKCPGCNKTFTDYPEFAIPYKRYTLPMIKAYSRQYVNDDEITYRGLRNKIPIGYPDSEKQMDHSTFHRWITTLGGYTDIIRKSQDLIVQQNPGSSVCRESANLSVCPAKYRSERRKQLLIQCRRLLKIENLYRAVFDVSIFPNLATSCGFS
jgi:transposase-like protein